MSADLVSFYDTIDPAFMLGEKLFTELKEHGVSKKDIFEYKQATVSLLKAYARFHKVASSRVALLIEIGVPLGALTSRVVANLSLVPLDCHIAAQFDILCYRRYVDDIVIVAHSPKADEGLENTLRRFLPVLQDDDTVLRFDVTVLDRQGSEFQLQKAKIRIHHLEGVQGIDFVEAVAFDFAKTVSEGRSFIDSATFVENGVSHLIGASETTGSPLRVLREADRAHLERFALSTSLSSLERVSSLISHDEARK